MTAVSDKIVAKALEMFNESGVEYVGMREIATALDMRIGNLTYYFPTKDALVDQIAQDLAAENNRTIVPMEHVTMKNFLEMLHRVFVNHVKYRCLMLSFVHLMKRNPMIARRYSKTQSRRNDTWLKNVQALQKAKYIGTKSHADIEFLVSSIALIARFWISEASISFKEIENEKEIKHYLRMIARIFLPYATARGKKEIAVFLD